MKVTCIGTKFFDIGTHIVLVKDTNNSLEMYSSELNKCHQVYVPAGYHLINYTKSQDQDVYVYENKEPVMAKVYKKKNEIFAPNFGVPIKKD